MLKETLSGDARKWAEENGLQAPFVFPQDVEKEPSGGFFVIVTEERERCRSAICYFHKDGSRDWYDLLGVPHG